ncbi:polysaccharide deacetylase family protein [Stutzerimonas nitrititolerans]|uniref:polysaccharide deacetylase family protein n=1 Tax=Stutzerimonas nitrititolerans TaxID=2482751 RepID=UPI0028A5C0A7|nr:polysaccharide deacetylase family protein [Stutzerimonas nitrititolerans]
MINKPWNTPAALAWLQILLQERFGHLFDVLPQSNSSRLAIALPGDARQISLKVDGAMFARSDSDLPCTEWSAPAEGWRTALPGCLPMPGAASPVVPLITATVNGWNIGYDILGLTYWMLNRIEEIGRTDLDNHGRFPATASHAYKHNYLERPVVDEWLHVLGQVISKTWPGIELKQHTFSMKVSHDVDAPSRYGFANAKGLLRAMAGDVLKRGDLKNPLRAPWIKLNSRNKIHSSDPYNTFEWIMDLSDQHGLTSAFYFICGRTSDLDADYEPEHPAIRALMRRIHERGHEIGLHPSYNTYQHPQMIAVEAQRLRKIAAEEGIEQARWGGRMHYLRWEQPTTLRAWAEAGMDYDSTLSYADRPGFRCGTCFEYPAFDPVENRELKLRVRPLVVMECSVIDACYSGLGVGEAAQQKLKTLKDVCRKVNGCFTLLWHNSSFANKSCIKLYGYAFR